MIQMLPLKYMLDSSNASHSLEEITEQVTRNKAIRRRRLAENPEGRTNTLTDEEFREKIVVLKEKTNYLDRIQLHCGHLRYRLEEEHEGTTILQKFIPYEPQAGNALAVVSVNTLPYTNRKSHNTYDYDQEDVILRRGEEFKMDVTFDRDVDTDNDIVTLQFVYGSRPKESKGTVIRLPLNIKTRDIGQCWNAVTETRTPTTIRCLITSPPDACIGTYDLYVETKLKDEDDEGQRFKYSGRIIYIFNPWCEADSVYMKNSDWREEYVMNDTGRIWVGSKLRNVGRPWNFGQFDKPVLDAVLYLLDKAELADEARNSPVSIVRTISAFVNSLDNDGMLEGRWTSEYPDDCTKPTSWTGSVPIVKEYMKTKAPVKYGQCWVFSGLTTTLLRAVGIPTRSVTNFESAHDTDCSMTIDKHYDEEGEPLEYLDDSTWNFHVWNESWFKRYDLPDGYDGWQAHDGTPQELSEGLMRCGPAPLHAIKEGHVYLNYDVSFILSEVNGDKIVWQVNEKDGTMKVMQINKHAVGWNISTKAVNNDNVELLDDQYKYPEFSDEERRVVKFVNRFSTRRKENIYKIESKREIDFDLLLPENDLVGEDFSVHINVKNIVDEKRDIVVKATLVNSYYTGLAGKRVKTIRFEETLAGGEEKRLTLPVTYKEYGPSMNPEGRFQLFVSGKNVSTGRMNSIEESFVLKKPDVMIEVPEEVEYGEETKATVTFKNTTNIKMTKCTFNVESPGVLDAVTLKYSQPLLPGKEWSEKVVLNPRRKYRRRREIVVEFSSKEVVDVEGSRKFKVVNNPSESDDVD